MSENSAAIELLKENQDKINWDHLSANSAAIDLLFENKNKINQIYLKLNKSIKSLQLMKNIDWIQVAQKEDIFIIKDKTSLIKKTLEIILT